MFDLIVLFCMFNIEPSYDEMTCIDYTVSCYEKTKDIEICLDFYED